MPQRVKMTQWGRDHLEVAECTDGAYRTDTGRVVENCRVLARPHKYAVVRKLYASRAEIIERAMYDAPKSEEEKPAPKRPITSGTGASAAAVVSTVATRRRAATTLPASSSIRTLSTSKIPGQSSARKSARVASPARTLPAPVRRGREACGSLEPSRGWAGPANRPPARSRKA